MAGDERVAAGAECKAHLTCSEIIRNRPLVKHHNNVNMSTFLSFNTPKSTFSAYHAAISIAFNYVSHLRKCNCVGTGFTLTVHEEFK